MYIYIYIHTWYLICCLNLFLCLRPCWWIFLVEFIFVWQLWLFHGRLEVRHGPCDGCGTCNLALNANFFEHLLWPFWECKPVVMLEVIKTTIKIHILQKSSCESVGWDLSWRLGACRNLWGEFWWELVLMENSNPEFDEFPPQEKNCGIFAYIFCIVDVFSLLFVSSNFPVFPWDCPRNQTPGQRPSAVGPDGFRSRTCNKKRWPKWEGPLSEQGKLYLIHFFLSVVISKDFFPQMTW